MFLHESRRACGGVVTDPETRMLAALVPESPDPGDERVMVCALGRDAGTVAEFARELAEHGGDPEAVRVVTCDLSPAFAKGVSEHLPNAERVADRFHVIRLATRQLAG